MPPMRVFDINEDIRLWINACTLCILMHQNTTRLQYFIPMECTWHILHLDRFATSDWNSHTRSCESWWETRQWRLCTKSYNHVAAADKVPRVWEKTHTHTYIEAKTNFRLFYLMVRKIGSSPDIIKIEGIICAQLRSMNKHFTTWLNN